MEEKEIIRRKKLLEEDLVKGFISEYGFTKGCNNLEELRESGE